MQRAVIQAVPASLSFRQASSSRFRAAYVRQSILALPPSVPLHKRPDNRSGGADLRDSRTHVNYPEKTGVGAVRSAFRDIPGTFHASTRRIVIVEDVVEELILLDVPSSRITMSSPPAEVLDRPLDLGPVQNARESSSTRWTRSRSPAVSDGAMFLLNQRRSLGQDSLSCVIKGEFLNHENIR